MLAVQADLTWVREDLGVVHEVMEKIAHHVSAHKNTTANVGEVHAQRSPHVYAWGTWRHESHGNECGRGDMTAMTDPCRGDAGDEEPSHAYGGEEAMSSIRESQMFDMQLDVDANTTSLEDEGGGGDWYENRPNSPAICSPHGK